MARIRTVKPEFWQSESVGRLSFGARLLFLGCLNFADDEGLIRWTAAYLMSQAFIYDDLSTEQLREWMDELVRERIVLPYQTGGTPKQQLGWIVNFRKHQVINRPQRSRLPPPSLENRDVINAYLERDGGRCHRCGGEFRAEPVDNCLDHVIPVSKGGTDHPSNIRAAHISCNKSRGNKDLPDSVNGSVNGSLLDSVAEVEVERERKGVEAFDTSLRSVSAVVGVVAFEKQKEETKAQTKAKGAAPPNVRSQLGSGSASQFSPGAPPDSAVAALRRDTWAAYDAAYGARYGTRPVRNARSNAMVGQIVARLGSDAPAVAGFYVGHPGAFYVTKVHPLSLLLQDAEGLRTQWASAQVVTGSGARMVEKTAERFRLVNAVIEKGRQEHEAGGGGGVAGVGGGVGVDGDGVVHADHRGGGG